MIESWHAHVYFGEETREAAWALRGLAADALGGAVEVGRFHERPVGPHPMWSFQLAFPHDRFERVVPWLALNRGALIVFVHPNTGEDLEDHRDRALWLGTGLELDLSIFDKDGDKDGNGS